MVYYCINNTLYSIIFPSERIKFPLYNYLNKLIENSEPNPISRAMSWINTNFKITTSNTDCEIAEIMHDGFPQSLYSSTKYSHFPFYSMNLDIICLLYKEFLTPDKSEKIVSILAK